MDLCVLVVCVFAEKGDAGVQRKPILCWITWGGCRWMGHNCGGCLAPSLQQHLRVQEMTFAQSPHYSPDGACLSVPALSLLSPSTKN